MRAPPEPSQAGPLSGFRGLIMLSARMFDGRERDEILRLVRSCVPRLVSCDVEAVYLRSNGEFLPAWPVATRDCPGPEGGALHAEPGTWRWAFPLTSMGSLLGYLVVRSPGEPSSGRWLLIEAICQQVAAALATA